MIRGSSGLGTGQAIVPEPPTPPWLAHIRDQRSGDVRVDIETHYSYPGGGQANDYEGDPSPEWTGGPYGFTNGGVMMLPQPGMQGFGDAAMSTGITTLPPMRVTANVVSSVGPTVTMAIGAGFGAALAPQHRAAGTLVGALVGGILGLIFSPG